MWKTPQKPSLWLRNITINLTPSISAPASRSSIRDLAALVVELTGYKGQIAWDSTKPDGQPRRMLDTRRALEAFGFRARTDFREGLRKTISWY